MYAIIKLSGKFYATKKSLSINDIDETVEYVEQFLEEGTPVTLVNDIEDACDLLGIDKDEITMV